ncbi:MAG: Gfo/Idh/MocA family oxidoreductase [Verrucomicrobiales bacterium]|jgi:predicted dehydrogenase|nr:Gfo/Idh/MocA family oxidoreductase [Verrucomicrobiales bacterium]
MSESLCRWGIIGTSQIARKNWHAIRNSGNGQLVAVASRSQERAQQYVDENQAQVPHDPAPRACGSYEQIIEADDIDAVYIPLPTGIRKDVAIQAAKAGKHVLCEKPCGVDAAEVREIIDACAGARNGQGVQFMDGVMFMHSDRLPRLREELDRGDAIGSLKRIATQFSFMAPEDFLKENIRVHSDLEPLGSLGDLGWYCIRFILWAKQYEMPTQVRAHMIRESGRPDSPDSVPISLSAELEFADGVTGSFYCSFETEHQQWVNLSGTKGHITMNDFVLPFDGAEAAFEIEQALFETDVCQFSMERHSRRIAVREHGSNHPTSQETKLFRNFADLALAGTPDSHWPTITLQTQEVLDACLQSARSQSTPVQPGSRP